MNGETVPIDEPFSNGLMFPGEPNCRCTLTYGIDESAITEPEPVEERPVVIEGLEGDAAESMAATAKSAEDYLAKMYPSLSSRWKGKLVVKDKSAMPDAAGMKHWTCEISLRRDYHDRKSLRYHTTLHEMLHAYSPHPDLKRHAEYYTRAAGWEEGVVEMQTRRNFKGYLKAMDEDPDIADRWQEWHGKRHAYNKYVEPLERIRKAIKVAPKKFYDDLLKIPAPDRPSYVYHKGQDAVDAGKISSGEFADLFDDTQRAMRTSRV